MSTFRSSTSAPPSYASSPVTMGTLAGLNPLQSVAYQDQSAMLNVVLLLLALISSCIWWGIIALVGDNLYDYEPYWPFSPVIIFTVYMVVRNMYLAIMDYRRKLKMLQSTSDDQRELAARIFVSQQLYFIVYTLINLFALFDEVVLIAYFTYYHTIFHVFSAAFLWFAHAIFFGAVLTCALIMWYRTPSDPKKLD